MLYYDRIDMSEKIHFNKTSELKEYNICHYSCILDKGLKFQPDVYNGCHDVLMMSMNLSDIANLNIHGVDYRRIVSGISKSEAINLMQNINLTEHYKN